MGFPGGAVVKNPANARDAGSVPGSGKSSWRKQWQTTPVFLPGKSHGQRSLAGYSPRDGKKSDTTNRLNNNNNVLYFECIIYLIRTS